MKSVRFPLAMALAILSSLPIHASDLVGKPRRVLENRYLIIYE